MATALNIKMVQTSNALRALGFTVENLDVAEFVGLWNIRSKHPLGDIMLYGEKEVNGRKIAVEVYYITNSDEVEIVLQTANKNFSNDFERMKDARSMVQFVYSWLQAENKY
ncbi:hypothetical protein LC76P1_00214 [Lysinibacillus phage LC76P1]|nr:hypothetical protein LC76P1_00214 [Lysinibacillus phage LC76P1]